MVTLHRFRFHEKGVRHLLCEAPSGPSRQKVPDPFFVAAAARRAARLYEPPLNSEVILSVFPVPGYRLAHGLVERNAGTIAKLAFRFVDTVIEVEAEQLQPCLS